MFLISIAILLSSCARPSNISSASTEPLTPEQCKTLIKQSMLDGTLKELQAMTLDDDCRERVVTAIHGGEWSQ